MTWSAFPWFATGVFICWGIGTWSFLMKKSSWKWIFLGFLLLMAYICSLGWGLARPPLRTLGETRLWYAACLSVSGLFIAWRWKIQWPLIYCSAVGAIFLVITLLNPETHDKTLMPVLRSAWFVPHVVVYILAYAFLTAAAILGARGLWVRGYRDEMMKMADGVVWLGLGLLTMGLLSGALWAKKAWGHYWSWDPKETWAFLTWASYLGYIHVRAQYPEAQRVACGILVGGWIILILCWFGVNVMPSAVQSIHSYLR